MADIKTKTVPWDAVDHLKTDEDIANYLEFVLGDCFAEPAQALLCRCQQLRRFVRGQFMANELHGRFGATSR